jgi:hypothetical protein
MMEHPTDDEIKLTKWFDGELSSDEISDLLAESPELFQQRMEVEEIGEMIRLHAQPSAACGEPPFPELFNRQVLRRISENPATQVRAWLEMAQDWFNNSHWALPTSAVAALCGILLSGTGILSQAPAHSEVLHTFAPHPGHKATAQYLPLAEATVIRLEGLEAIAPSEAVIGYLQRPNESSRGLASTVAYPLRGLPSPKDKLPSAHLQLASSNPR